VRQQTDILNRTTKTLAELLKEHGFATGAFLGSVVLDSRYGLNRGFDSYYDRFKASAGAQESSQSSGRLPNLERSAGEVAKAALAWISSQSGRPFFAWVHFYDPHDPYRPPEPFSARYKSAPYDGEI